MFANKKVQLLLLLLFFHRTALVAQESVTDSALYKMAFNNVIRFYTGKTGGYHLLFNGSEYLYTYAGIKGHPYFITDSFQNSQLYYDGMLYQQIPLKYDMVTSEVIITGKEDRVIKLSAEKLDYFIIAGNRFIRIREDSNAVNAPEPGFYQLLYEGPLTALVSRKKVAIRSLRAEDPYQFALYDKYYIRKNEKYFPIINKKDLIELLAAYKDLADKYRKVSNRRFKSDMESIILTAVAEYARKTK